MKNNLIYTKKLKETCILVGVVKPYIKREKIEENIEELSSLAHTAELEIKNSIIQERKRIDPAYFLGHGKAQKIYYLVNEYQIDTIIFDDELTPAQFRNWEQLTGKKIIDRSALILDIFASHARTKEARTQVELAQLNYILPRLTRQWTHLSRQVGGVGTKGPGETQLETDKRLIRSRINHLKKELHKIEKQRDVQRKRSDQMFKAALVGYTNSGKSTLLNALTGASTHIEDKLFATLDTMTKRLILNNDNIILITDTVGFIRNLPHQLIASFKSTLAQTSDADILLNVIDISDPDFKTHIEITNDIFSELGIGEKITIQIFNKVDKLPNSEIIQQLKAYYPNSLFVSGKKNIRIEKIKSLLLNYIKGYNAKYN